MSSSSRSSLPTTLSLISCFLLERTTSVCNYIYIEEAPVPLETCYWSSPYDSYGLYCVDSYNGTVFTSPKVLELWFPATGCPNGLNAGNSQFWALHDCTDDCYCSGSSSDCLVMTRRTYDYNTGFNPGCNFTYYIDEKFVWDVCIDVGILGSKGYSCSAQGTEAGDWLKENWYTNSACTGAQKDTPAPSMTPAPTAPCQLSTCSGDIVVPTTEAKKSNAGGVAAAIIIVLLLLIVCGVGIWWWTKKRSRKQGQVTFDGGHHGDHDDHTGMTAQDIDDAGVGTTGSGEHRDDQRL